MINSKVTRPKAWLLMLAVAPAAALFSAERASADNATWLAAPTNGNWITTTETNWSTGAATFVGSTAGNSNPDIATFSQTSSVTAVNITNSLTISGILFDTASASAYTINRTAGTFRVSDGGAISETSTVVNPELITAAMTLNATSSSATTSSYMFNNDSTTVGATLTFSGAITTGSGAANLVTTFNLSGANIGNNLISGVISDQGAAKPLNLIKSGTGTWILGGNNTYNGITTISGGILQVGNVGASSTTGSLGVGAVTDNGSLIFNRSNSMTVANAISGNGSVSQTGSGTLTLSGNNSYNGPTTISGGAIFVGSSTALGTSALTFDSTHGGLLDLNGFDTTVTGLSGTFLAQIIDNNSTAGTSTLILSGGGTSNFSGVIADGVSRFVALDVTGGATLNLTGLNSYTGGTTIDNGILQISNAGNLGSEGGVLTISNGTLHIPTTAGNFTENRTFQLASATSTIQVDPGITFDIAGGIMDFTSPGTLNKTGTGILLLDSPDFYTGGTTITNGTIQLGDNAALGNGPLSIAASTTLDMHGFSGTAGTLSGAGTITSAASGSVTLTIGDSNSSTFTGVIQNGSGNVSLVKRGTGSISLKGNDTYTGTTLISGGTIVVNTAASLGSTSGGAVTITAGGTLDLSGDLTANNLNFSTKSFSIGGAGVDGVSGAIINNSGVTQTSAFENISLNADATIGGSSRYDLRNGVATLDLNLHTLTKTGSNQFSIVGGTIKDGGSIVVSQGILSLETTTTTVGAGSITYNANTFAQFFNNTGSIPWTLNFLGENVIGNASGSLATVAAPMVLMGNVTFEPLNSGALSPTSNNPLTFTGNISQSGGSFGITKLGVNTLTLSGTNTWDGPTNIQQGTLFLNSANALPTGAAVTLGSGTNSGTIDLNAHNVTLSSLTTSGTGGTNLITNTNASPAIINYNGGISTYSGVIGGIPSGNQAISLSINSGILTLTGLNTYAGNNTLNAGILSVSSNANLGSSVSPISFNGGTLQITDTSFTSTARTINWSTTGGTFNIASPANTFSINSPLSGGGLSQVGAGTLVLGQNLNVTTGDPTVVTIGSLQFNGASNSVSAINGGGNVTVNPGAALTSDGVQLSNLSVGGSAMIRQNIGAPALSTVSSLTLAGAYGGSASDTTSVWTGAVDITNSKLVVEDTSVNRANDLAILQNQALAANTAGNTVGIYSSTAAAANLAAGKTVMVVAVSDNAVRMATFPAGSMNFGGINNVDANSILVAAVFKGDANMDGVVDIQDLTDVANHWQQSVTDWSQGDFDGSNFVDIQDLTSVANNWQAGVGAGGGQSFSDALAQIGGFKPAVAVPEPASLAMLGLGGLVLTSRRRNKR